MWVKPRKNKSPCETCQPICRINPVLCQGVSFWIGSFLSADNTSVGHQHFPEGGFRGEQVLRWRKMVYEEKCSLLRALPSCSISSGVHSRWFQQRWKSSSLKSIKAILNTVGPTYGFFKFCISCVRKNAQPSDAGRGNAFSCASSGPTARGT